MASELKPCPFCGGTDVNLYHSAKTFMSWVSCKSCGLEAPSETGITDAEAITYWNTRSAPAATDAGLVTIGGINLASGEMISCKDFDDGNPLHIPCCRKDRAEELLAAERAEKEEARQAWKEAVAMYEQEKARVDPALKRVSDLEADNAAMDARIKERDEYRSKWQSIMEQENSSRKTYLRHTEALEAKLAAANDLVVRAQVIIPDHYVNWHRDARAVLGGKPS